MNSKFLYIVIPNCEQNKEAIDTVQISTYYSAAYTVKSGIVYGQSDSTNMKRSTDVRLCAETVDDSVCTITSSN